MDVVFDVYREISINLEFKKIVSFQLIKQWNSFFSSASNKTELIKFVAAERKKNTRLFFNKLLYLTCEQECFVTFEANCSIADHLLSTLEKADTRLLLYGHDASLNYQDIIIHTPNTDWCVYFGYYNVGNRSQDFHQDRKGEQLKVDRCREGG